MTKVSTLFGDFDDSKLKQLKGYVDEVVLHMNRNDSNNQAIKDDKLHNVRMNSDQLNPIEWDLPKSGVDSPESYTKLKDGGMQA